MSVDRADVAVIPDAMHPRSTGITAGRVRRLRRFAGNGKLDSVSATNRGEWDSAVGADYAKEGRRTRKRDGGRDIGRKLEVTSGEGRIGGQGRFQRTWTKQCEYGTRGISEISIRVLSIVKNKT